MADLDDFFAKKDRKKSKTVKKFATADEIAKKLDDTKQKTDVKPKRERPVQEGEEGGRPAEEEWKEYEETVKDYTGLKIQVLQGGANAPESRDASDSDAAPEGGRGKGPWNKTGQPEGEQPPPPPPPPVEEKPRETKSAAYVPPASRTQRAPEPLRRNQAKHAPDIHNDDYFPQLGAGATRGRGGGWSTAGGGGGGGAPRAAAARTPLALGNRYTSLQDDS